SLAPSSPADGGDGERSWQIARPASPRGGAKATKGEAAAGRAADTRGGHSASPVPRTEGASSGPGEPATGAGSATDPALLGTASEPHAGNETFDLPIAARVRSAGGGPRPPTGDAPPAGADKRPDLAARQRRDAPVLRTGVPVAYEAIVRHVFAHA